MSKRLKGEDLEQDILIEYSSRFMHFYEQNKATVYGSAIAIVAVIGLTIGYFVYSGQQETEAMNLLGQAEQQFMQGNYQTALYGDDDEFTIGFVQIADNYSRTNAGNLANYYAAVSEFEMENYDDALYHIKNFSIPNGIVGVSPITLHAIILSELERYEEAAEMYVKAAKWDENSSTTPHNLLEAALAYKEAGMNREATDLLDELLRDYPNSNQAAEAERLLGQLTQ